MNNSVRLSRNRSPRTRVLSRVFPDNKPLVMVGLPTSRKTVHGT